MLILDSGSAGFFIVRTTNQDPALRDGLSAIRHPRDAGRGVRIAECENHESESEYRNATGARAKMSAIRSEPLVIGTHSPVNT